MLNMFYYLLIFVAAIRLRRKEPDLERPFRIWGNTAVLTAICAPAIFIALVTIYTNAIDTETEILGHTSFSLSSFTFGWYGIGGLIGLLAGPVAYVIFKKNARREDRRARRHHLGRGLDTRGTTHQEER